MWGTVFCIHCCGVAVDRWWCCAVGLTTCSCFVKMCRTVARHSASVSEWTSSRVSCDDVQDCCATLSVCIWVNKLTGVLWRCAGLLRDTQRLYLSEQAHGCLVTMCRTVARHSASVSEWTSSPAAAGPWQATRPTQVGDCRDGPGEWRPVASSSAVCLYIYWLTHSRCRNSIKTTDHCDNLLQLLLHKWRAVCNQQYYY